MNRKLPINNAKIISDTYGWDQIIIIGRKINEQEIVVTYGDGKANCEVAARAGNVVKHHLMQWPDSLLDTDLRIVDVYRSQENPNAVSIEFQRIPKRSEISLVEQMLTPNTKSPKEIENGV